LNDFQKFYQIKDYDSLAGIEAGEMQIMVEDYVMHLIWFQVMTLNDL